MQVAYNLHRASDIKPDAMLKKLIKIFKPRGKD